MKSREKGDLPPMWMGHNWRVWYQGACVKGIKDNLEGDFPGGRVVRNPPAGAGDTGSIPGSRRSHMPRSKQAHAPQLLKPTCLEPVLCNKRSHCNEKPMHCNEE